MARILFVHNNFPAQFRALAEALQAKGDACAAVASRTGRQLGAMPIARWTLGRGTTAGIFPAAIRAEADLVRAHAAARAAEALRDRGWVPDLIVGHPGWGETVFLREVFPAARQILYGEFYYRSRGADVGFDPEFGEPDAEMRERVHAKNATGALAYLEADRIVSPTAFQAGCLPAALRDRVRVIHDGIDTDAIRPGPPVPITLADGSVLDGSVPTVTFVNRRFEPMRGFHTFMRALPLLLERVPTARAVLIGRDEAGGYGAAAGPDTTWARRMLAELAGRLDLSRVHFTGPLPLDQMHALLRLGTAHVYLTYPFALSWSCLEAMALGCLVVGSRTPPVQEVITDGVNGVLVDMLDPEDLAGRLIEICRGERAGEAALRAGARRWVVERFDRRRVCLPAWLHLVDEVLGRTPAAIGPRVIH